MNNRDLAIENAQHLPADTPLTEIARAIELRAGIEAARAQASRGDGQPVEQVRKLVDQLAEDRLEISKVFEAKIKESERQMREGQRPRIR